MDPVCATVSVSWAPNKPARGVECVLFHCAKEDNEKQRWFFTVSKRATHGIDDEHKIRSTPGPCKEASLERMPPRGAARGHCSRGALSIGLQWLRGQAKRVFLYWEEKMLDVGSGMRQQDLGAGERVFYPWPGCPQQGCAGRTWGKAAPEPAFCSA